MPTLAWPQLLPHTGVAATTATIATTIQFAITATSATIGNTATAAITAMTGTAIFNKDSDVFSIDHFPTGEQAFRFISSIQYYYIITSLLEN